MEAEQPDSWHRVSWDLVLCSGGDVVCGGGRLQTSAWKGGGYIRTGEKWILFEEGQRKETQYNWYKCSFLGWGQGTIIRSWIYILELWWSQGASDLSLCLKMQAAKALLLRHLKYRELCCLWLINASWSGTWMFKSVSSTCHVGSEVNQPSEEAQLAFLLVVGGTLWALKYSQLLSDMASCPSCGVFLAVR